MAEQLGRMASTRLLPVMLAVGLGVVLGACSSGQPKTEPAKQAEESVPMGNYRKPDGSLCAKFDVQAIKTLMPALTAASPRWSPIKSLLCGYEASQPTLTAFKIEVGTFESSARARKDWDNPDRWESRNSKDVAWSRPGLKATDISDAKYSPNFGDKMMLMVLDKNLQIAVSLYVQDKSFLTDDMRRAVVTIGDAAFSAIRAQLRATTGPPESEPTDIASPTVPAITRDTRDLRHLRQSLQSPHRR